MFSRYKIILEKCCYIMDEISRSDERKLIYLTTIFGTSTRRIGVKIDTVFCRYCPFCGEEFKFKLIEIE